MCVCVASLVTKSVNIDTSCREVTSDTHHCIIEKHFRDKDESIKLEKTRKREMDEALKDRKKYCLYPSGLVAKVKLWDAFKVEKMKNERGRGQD